MNKNEISHGITSLMLLEQARKAADNSYSPYSHFRVGAALLCDDGTIITGTNVENRSFGATICAEQSATTRAVTLGHRSFIAIAIAGLDSDKPLAPCGICRQILSEFSPQMQVIMSDNNGEYETGKLDQMFTDDLLQDFKNNFI